MTQSDEEFFRHLYKQLEEQRKDRNLTTIRVLQKRNKQKPAPKNKPSKNK